MPRNLIGGPDLAQGLAGAPILDGKGMAPDSAPDPKAIGGWPASGIACYLDAGFTPDGDAVDGPMTDMVENMSHIAKVDRDAIATYSKAAPQIAPRPR